MQKFRDQISNVGVGMTTSDEEKTENVIQVLFTVEDLGKFTHAHMELKSVCLCACFCA